METEELNLKPSKWTATSIGLEILGWFGAILLLVGYYLIQTENVERDNQVYIMLNVVGAFCLMINAWYHGAYPSAITNFIWLIIGSFYAYKFYREEFM